MKPLCTERYARWCEGAAANHRPYSIDKKISLTLWEKLGKMRLNINRTEKVEVQETTI